MKYQPDELQTYTRIALTLFTLCLLILCAIWFLSRTLYDNAKGWKSKLEWQEATRAMLERSRALTARNEDLFVGLSVAAWDEFRKFESKKIEQASIRGDIEKFGARASAIFNSTKDN